MVKQYQIVVSISQLKYSSQISENNCLPIPTVLFYRDSTAIIGILALNTVIVRVLMGLECEVPQWLASPVDMVKDSAAGKFVVDHGRIKMEKMEEGTEDDTTILVEPKANDHKNTLKWTFVASLIDRLVLIIVTLTYFFLIILLIPENYESSEGLPAIEIASTNVQQ